MEVKYYNVEDLEKIKNTKEEEEVMHLCAISNLAYDIVEYLAQDIGTWFDDIGDNEAMAEYIDDLAYMILNHKYYTKEINDIIDSLDYSENDELKQKLINIIKGGEQ